jgi:general stress protein YciG
MASVCRGRPQKEKTHGERRQGSEGRSKGGQNPGGNFKNDPQRAAEAGRKGGQESGGNFRNDPKRASVAGKTGGKGSNGGRR